MTQTSPKALSLIGLLKNLYQEKLPFNRVLGLDVQQLSFEKARVGFQMKPDLVGNVVHKTLHGGVISAVLDATGGLMATAGLIEKQLDKPEKEILMMFARVGTIDLRVDYLRPGRGKSFSACASIMRPGKKVAVTRMGLLDDGGLLSAVGTGTYLVG